jgi:multidrug transporter EmrE-like cation transporter
MTVPFPAGQPGVWQATAMIASVVLASTAGEVLTAAAMKSIGDLDLIRARSGMKGAIRAVVTCPLFFAGVFFLALAFFALLFALNHLNLSLAAAVLVCVGVYLLAH